MIMVPDFVERPLYEAAVARSRDKLGEPPVSLRLEPLDEGRCLQTLHIGSYDDEGPTLAKLHNEIMPGERGDVCRAPSRDLSERSTQDAAGKAQDRFCVQPVRSAG